MGEFTTRFDAEILRSKFAEMEAERQKQAKEKAEVDKVDRMLEEIGAILEKRAHFVEERFPNATRQPLEGTGFCFTFAETPDRKQATFSLTAHIKESRLAIAVESRFEVPAIRKKQYDYVNTPTTQPDVERARRFIESKLFEFARDYVAC